VLELFRILVGAALLTLGRRLFWLFVAGVGFVSGLWLARLLIDGAPAWLSLLIGLIAGLIGAGVALLLQRLGIAVAGFLAGGYAVYSLVDLFASQTAGWLWVVYVIGGILGAVLLSVLFDWALIVLSSILGSVVILQSLDLTTAWSGVLFFVLLIVGVAAQSAARGHARRRAAQD
jgi:hypothetical protein